MKPGKNRKLRGIIAGGAAVVLLLAAVIGGTAWLERAQQNEREQELQALGKELRESPWTAGTTVSIGGEKFGTDHRMETYLFIGTDQGGNDDPDDYRGEMADFLLLMVLDHTENTIGYLQIDRNTVTDVRELTREGEEITSRKLQICTAHWYGRNPEMAAENTVYAVQKLLGLGKIDGYFELNVGDVGLMNRAVGGVEVTIAEDLTPDDPTLRKGETLVLDDGQAERFVRARMGVGEGTNRERMSRQRQYMAGFFRKVKEKTAEDPKYGLNLWQALRDAAVSDMNGNDFSRIAQKMLKGTDKGIQTLEGETVLGQVLQDGEEHEEFYADSESLLKTMKELFSLKIIQAARVGRL